MKIKKLFIALCAAVISTAVSFARSVPSLIGPVVDAANLLSAGQKEALDAELRSIYENDGPQIAVLTIKSLEGEDLEDFSMKVCENWKLGSADREDGVLLLVSLDEKKIRIEVGYGLEGILTDTKCGLIIRNIMAPEFQAGRYGDGIVKAVRTIENLAGYAPEGAEDFDLEIPEKDSDKLTTKQKIIMFLIILFFISGSLSQKVSWLRWLPWAFLFRNSGRGGGGGSHHGGGGYHGGDGYHGGGGGFGGGGASGGW